ncbi:TVP38/TMEM64 family protein [Bacillus ndiopicus]|uniref:TVP38/TMEM64 family protein n=1 Tax=Bacillus ndiopicus TaxID=1347368 RepID=UPI0005AB3FF8|nr:VTT domain-containing protein [Bacillus ndiopicus]
MDTIFIDWLQTPSFAKGAASFLLLLALSFVPFMPIAIVYSTIGLAYPLWIALAINISGSVLGAILMFVLCKNFLKNYYEKKLNKLNQSSKFFTLLQKNGFLAILIARLIPFLPTALVNIICGAFQVPLKTYALATLLGKLPSIVIYSFVGNQLLEKNYFVFSIAAIYLVILLVLSRKLKKSWDV